MVTALLAGRQRFFFPHKQLAAAAELLVISPSTEHFKMFCRERVGTFIVEKASVGYRYPKHSSVEEEKVIDVEQCFKNVQHIPVLLIPFKYICWHGHLSVSFSMPVLGEQNCALTGILQGLTKIKFVVNVCKFCDCLLPPSSYMKTASN